MVVVRQVLEYLVGLDLGVSPDHPFWKSLEGTGEFYDFSLFERLGLSGQVAGKRVLDVGASGLHSTCDILKAGAREVVAIDPYPFALGSPLSQDLIDELVFLQAMGKGVDPKKIKLCQKSLGAVHEKILGTFDRIYWFFPPVCLVGNYPEYHVQSGKIFGMAVQNGCSLLNKDGSFTIVTDVPANKVRGVEVIGFRREIRGLAGKRGYTEKERINRLNGTESSDYKPIKPASGLRVGLLEYSPLR